ncbi:uncharacterized protein LOC100569502 [Acyrthosiphon pisum]|uniref:Uncharacterized protein n=1 Tax=Acyrthosiphon pisum TaxID=7029 RepID=A0A8R2D2W8_ACYPI|nr:uncharacterized protein LOC100569502 [Acyrthosiphon pisum]
MQNAIVCPNATHVKLMTIRATTAVYNAAHLQSLIDFEDGSHNVYLFYKHQTLDEWNDAIFFGDFQTEAQKVHEFINLHAVKGLILDGIDDPLLSEDGGGNFHKNFAAYVTAIKTENPDLEIGFYLSARLFIINANETENSTWFDFCKMNDVLDFYVIEFATFNICSEKFLHGGITPLQTNSTNPDDMTLNTFAAVLNQSTIAKDKVYFEFLISPIPTPEEVGNFKHCELSYNEYCENHDQYQEIWCVDDQDILNKKGKFAKDYSNGFIGRDIDLVDRDNKCGCNNKYVTFYMLLDGYNNANDPLTC